MSQKLEHIRRGDLHRILPGHRKERLQIEGHRPQRVRPAPARHELQIPVHQPLAQPVTDLARPRHETHKTREVSHFSNFPARVREQPGTTRITCVLSVRRAAHARDRLAKLTQRDSRRVGFTADAGRVPPAARHAGPVAPGTARSDASTPAAGVTNPQRHAPEPRLGRTPCRPLTAYLPRLKQPTWAASI